MSDTYALRFVDDTGQSLAWDRTEPPDPIGVEFELPDYRARLTLRRTGRRYAARRVEVIAHDDGPDVAAYVLSGLRLGTLVDVAARAIAHTATAAETDGARAWAAPTTITFDAPSVPLAAVFERLGLPAPDLSGPRPVAGEGTTDLLRGSPRSEVTRTAVKAVYEYALSLGLPGNATVAQFFSIRRSTAQGWIEAATEGGEHG